MSKLWLRRLFEAIAAIAVLALVFDNRATEVEGLVMLGSFAIVVICVLVLGTLGGADWLVVKGARSVKGPGGVRIILDLRSCQSNIPFASLPFGGL
jgi:hypothetical protein